jgi:hypothetical protein
MTAFLQRADTLLRAGPGAIPAGRVGHALLHLGVLVVVFGMLYGAVMGAFTGLEAGHRTQLLYSALKVPLLLLVAFLLALPSFFVLNTLAGLRDDFGDALRALVATQAGLTVILASLSPLTALWYLSSTNYPSAVLFNAVMFAIASFAAQILLRRFYAPLIARSEKHRWLLRAWLLLYAFVGIQLGWLLRPFIGSPDAPAQFFRDKMWGNAYVEVAQLVGRLFGN